MLPIENGFIFLPRKAFKHTIALYFLIFLKVDSVTILKLKPFRMESSIDFNL